jgi:hypothetical protein
MVFLNSAHEFVEDVLFGLFLKFKYKNQWFFIIDLLQDNFIKHSRSLGKSPDIG